MSKLLQLAKEFSQLNLPTDPNLRVIAIQDYVANENQYQEKNLECVSVIGRTLVTTTN
jgi:hypothetical protein